MKVGSHLQPKSPAACCLCRTEKWGCRGRGGRRGQVPHSSSQWTCLPSGCCRQLKHTHCFGKCRILSSNIQCWPRMCELGSSLAWAPDYSQWKVTYKGQFSSLVNVFLTAHQGSRQWETHQRAVKCWKWINAHWTLGALKIKGTVTLSLQCPCT